MRRGRPSAPVVLARALGPVAAPAAGALARVRPGAAARLALAAGDEDGAGRHAARALERRPGDRDALRVTAALLERAGEPMRALEAARRAGDGPAARRIEGTLRVLGARPAGPAAATYRPAARPPRALVLLESSLPQAPSGYAFRSQAVLRALARAGIEPVVATRLGFPASRGLPFEAIERVDGIDHHRLWLPGVRRYTAVPADVQLEAAVERLQRLADEVEPALIWAATPQPNALAGLALRDRLGVPLVYDVRGFPELTWEAEHGRASELSRAREAAETAAMHAADRVVTLGEVMRERIVGRGIPAVRVVVLPHVADPPAAGPPSSEPLVVMAGTLRAYEGADVLLDAVARLASRGIGAVPRVLGGGPELAALRAQAARMGLDPVAVLPGPVPRRRAAETVARAAVVVVPRRDEAVCRWVVPMKPLDALAAARPLVMSRLPALEELGGEGRARLAAPGDPEDLAAQIAADLADPAGAGARAAAAATWALERHGEPALDAAVSSALEGLGG